MMPNDQRREKGNKKQSDAQKRSQILAAYTSGGDWRKLYKDLRVSKATTYRWVSEGDKEDKRGGARSIKINQEHRDFMIDEIERNPRITLALLNEKIYDRFGVKVAHQTISNHLDNQFYSLKAIRHAPENGNSPENIEKRQLYVQSLLHIKSTNMPICYMDETNFNIHISRTRGRSRIGDRCSVVSAASKGANVHLIGCISSLGLIHSELRRGSFTKELAQEWMRQCLRNAINMHGGMSICMVIDNAPCHSKMEEVFEEEEFQGSKLLRLSPYSQMLNPIENIWSVVKAKVKRELAGKIQEILSNCNNQSLSISEYRLLALEELMNEAMGGVTPALCESCVNHCTRHFAADIKRRPMEY